MSNPGLFKDLGKRVSDLLTKEFPVEEKKYELKLNPNPNVTIETNTVQKKDGSVVSTVTPSYKYKEYGTTFLAEVNTKKDIKLETTVENQGVAGSKVIVTGESKGDQTYGILGVEYKHPNATVTASVDYGKPKGSTLKATSVFGASGYALGLSTEYFFGTQSPSELKNFNTTLAYTSRDFDVTLFGRLIASEDKNELGGTFYHNVTPALTIGSEVVFDTANADNKPKLALASQYKFNEDTIAKVKFDTNGIVGVGVQQRFNKNSKITFGSSIDTNNTGKPLSSTFGFTWSLSG